MCIQTWDILQVTWFWVERSKVNVRVNRNTAWVRTLRVPCSYYWHHHHNHHHHHHHRHHYGSRILRIVLLVFGALSRRFILFLFICSTPYLRRCHPVLMSVSNAICRRQSPLTHTMNRRLSTSAPSRSRDKTRTRNCHHFAAVQSRNNGADRMVTADRVTLLITSTSPLCLQLLQPTTVDSCDVFPPNENDNGNR